MSAVLPLPEPPSEAAAAALERLRNARVAARDAALQFERLDDERKRRWREFEAAKTADQEQPASIAWYVIEREVAAVRRDLWARHVAVLENRCRRLGLDPTAGAGTV